MQDILINWAPQETRVAIVENGAVQELHVERALERGRVGNIYTGRVARVLPGMQSAFIDIGLERAAFLHVADLQVNSGPRGSSTARRGASGVKPPAQPIEKLVFEGQTLMVQVIKDPIGSKGARLSTQISIAGRLLVFLPQDDHIGVCAEDRLARTARGVARARAGAGRATAAAASSCAPTPRRRPTTNSPTTSPTCARPGPRCASAASRRRRHAAAPGPEPGRARAARPGRRHDAVDPHRLADAVRAAAEVRRRVHADLGGEAGALQRRAADLRPVQDRRGDRQARWRGAST